jgi:hypothetical protein
MQLSWGVIHQLSSERNTTRCGYSADIRSSILLFYLMSYDVLVLLGKNVKSTHWAVCQLTSPKM